MLDGLRVCRRMEPRGTARGDKRRRLFLRLRYSVPVNYFVPLPLFQYALAHIVYVRLVAMRAIGQWSRN